MDSLTYRQAWEIYLERYLKDRGDIKSDEKNINKMTEAQANAFFDSVCAGKYTGERFWLPKDKR